MPNDLTWTVMGARLRLYESSSLKLTCPPGPTSTSAVICAQQYGV